MGNLSEKQLIIINGFSCTGKTTLAKFLSNKLNIPYFSSDEIKDQIMDTIGEVEQNVFYKFNPLSYEIMYSVADQILKNGQSVILESSYHNNQFNVDRINLLSESNGTKIKQIFMYTDNIETVWQRMQDRKSQRHSGHADNDMTFEMLKEKMNMEKYRPLSLRGTLLKINTLDYSKVEDQKILEFIQNISN